MADLPFVDEHGAPVSLAAFHGKVLVLAQFLTSCQETCPLTTGAFLTIESDLRAAHLTDKVVLAEMTTDPDRDIPSRLVAYQAYTGADWTMITGTAANIATFWHYFGIYYEKVAEENPPGIDWQTGRPYAYDVDHANGFIVFDPAGHERFVTGAAPNLHGKVEPQLRRLLDENGIADLQRPDPQQTWTISDALGAIGAVLGQPISASP